MIFVVGFFFIERSVKDPAVPPRTWSNQNFLPLFLYSWRWFWTRCIPPLCSSLPVSIGLWMRPKSNSSKYSRFVSGNHLLVLILELFQGSLGLVCSKCRSPLHSHWQVLYPFRRFLPYWYRYLGVSGGAFAYLTGVFAPHIPRRVLLIGGQVCVVFQITSHGASMAPFFFTP